MNLARLLGALLPTLSFLALLLAIGVALRPEHPRHRKDHDHKPD